MGELVDSVVWDARDENRYLSLTVLGKGSYGEVSLAIRKEDSKAHFEGWTVAKFAVKQFFVQNNDLQWTKLAASREVRILSAIQQAPICDPRVLCYVEHYVGLPSNNLFLVTRYEKGKILYDVQSKNGKYFRAVLKSALDGLKFLHARNIAHRDIKGDNIMVQNADTDVPSVVYLDLGLGCNGDDDCYRQPATVAVHRSPEQIEEVLVNQRLFMPEYKASDVWFLAQAIYRFGSQRNLFSTSMIDAEIMIKKRQRATVKDLRDRQKLEAAISLLKTRVYTELRKQHVRLFGNDENNKTLFVIEGMASKMTIDKASQAIVVEMLKLDWRKRLIAAVGVAILDKYDIESKKPTAPQFPKLGFITDYRTQPAKTDSDSIAED